jgi:hypothetical protein
VVRAAKVVAAETADRSCMRHRWPIIWSTESWFSLHLERWEVRAAAADRVDQVAPEVLRAAAAIVAAVEMLARPGLSAMVETKEWPARRVRMEMCVAFERELRTLWV